MSAINLPEVNAWLDVAFATLEVVVIIGVTLHFLASMLVGRFQDLWLKGFWIKHDGPPIPPLPKVMHAINLSMFILLVFSGMSIRFPMWDGARLTMRYIHYFAMTVVAVNYLSRVGYAFFSKRRDYGEFAIKMPDIKSAIGVIMYYLYVKNTKPHVAKYNVLQKSLYVGIALMIPIQGLTGFSMLTQNIMLGHSPRYWMTFWWASAIGGIATAGAWMRVIHYTFNWLFIVMVTMHFYMAWSQDFPAFVTFFGFEWKGPGSDVWKEKRRAKGLPVPEPVHSEAH